MITFVGVDRPGIVQELTALVREHEGNWLESKMTRMAGKFAGVAMVEIRTEALEGLTTAFQDIPEMSVMCESSGRQGSDAGALGYQLNIVGLDRLGILQEVTKELSVKQINVIDLDTRVAAAPMSGDKMFYADASVLVPSSVDLVNLHERLDVIADDLGVDILLELLD